MSCLNRVGNALSIASNALGRAADVVGGKGGNVVAAVVTGSTAVMVGHAVWGNPVRRYLKCEDIVNTVLPKKILNDHFVQGVCGNWWIRQEIIGGRNLSSYGLMSFGIGTTVAVITGLTSIYFARRAYNDPLAQNLQEIGRQCLGSARQYLGSARQYLGSARQYLGSARQYLENNLVTDRPKPVEPESEGEREISGTYLQPADHKSAPSKKEEPLVTNPPSKPAEWGPAPEDSEPGVSKKAD